MDNIFAELPEDVTAEHFEIILQAKGFVLERIVSHGQSTPPGEWLDQDREEWVILLKGSAGLLMAGEDEVRVMRPGDHIHIPAHQRHRVEWTQAEAETIWLAVHFEPNA